MCSQMVHLPASEPLQVLRAVYLKLASSYFPAPKIENFSCAKKNSNRCKVILRPHHHHHHHHCHHRPPKPQRFTEADLQIVKDSGHTMMEPGTISELVQATERFKSNAPGTTNTPAAKAKKGWW